LIDVWHFLRSVAPNGFVAARENAELVGYAIFVPSLLKQWLLFLDARREG